MEAVVRRRVAQVSSQHCHVLFLINIQNVLIFNQLPIQNITFLYFQVIAADEGGGHGRSNESLLAGAMAMALAHVNRQQAAAPAGSKVLVASSQNNQAE